MAKPGTRQGRLMKQRPERCENQTKRHASEFVGVEDELPLRGILDGLT